MVVLMGNIRGELRVGILVFAVMLLLLPDVHAGGGRETPPEPEPPARERGPGTRIQIPEPPAEETPDPDRLLPIWDVMLHQEDRERAIREISQVIEMGMLPVGLHTAPESPHLVLYGANPGIPVTDVALHRFPNPETVPAELGALIDEGWLPMGLAVPGGHLTTLLIRTPVETRRWGVAFTEVDVLEIAAEADRRQSDGFSLWAIGVEGERMWLFFVEEAPGAPRRDTRIMVFPFVEQLYTPAIDQLAVQEGWYPWAVTIVEDEMIMVLTRTEEN